MSQKKSDLSRWKQIEFWDLVCLLYWSAIFLSFCVLFDWPIDFRESLAIQTRPRKFFVLIGFWSASLLLIKTVYGFIGSYKVLWRIYKSPLSFIKICLSFAWDTRKIFKKYLSNFPIKTAFFILLVLTIILGMTETSMQILNILLPFVWIELAILLFFCFSWTLNPFPFLSQLETLKQSISEKARARIINTYTLIEVSKAEDAQSELLKRLDSFKSMVEYIPRFIKWMSGPKLQFSIFLLIFVFGGAFSLILISIILRIEHLTTPGGAFEGKFFTGAISDYFYISLNHFVSAEVYNISVISSEIRYTLSLLPVTSLTLTVLLMLAFTMVGTTRVTDTFRNIENEILIAVSEASKQVIDKKQVVLIDRRGDNTNSKPIESKTNKTSSEMTSHLQL